MKCIQLTDKKLLETKFHSRVFFESNQLNIKLTLLVMFKDFNLFLDMIRYRI